jgi:UDP-N-acetylglucosamine acyltransferase
VHHAQDRLSAVGTQIHPTAVVSPQAQLGEGVSIGPYSVIGEHVVLGDRTTVLSHCVLDGHSTFGADNRIGPYASLGGPPQDKKYKAESTQLIVGSRNTIREFTTFNTGTTQDEGITSMGDDNWVMAYAHLAHDVRVGHRCILANNAQIAGHVTVGDWVILGGFTCVHQFVKIGSHSMTGLGTVLSQDLPPFIMASGNLASASGFNAEGLKRRGFSPERLAAVKQMYRALYRKSLTLEQARSEIAAIAAPDAKDDIAMMSTFLAAAERGIVR